MPAGDKEVPPGMDTGEEVVVDVVHDDGSPKRQPMSWVVEEIGRAVGEVREKGCMAVKRNFGCITCIKCVFSFVHLCEGERKACVSLCCFFSSM